MGNLGVVAYSRYTGFRKITDRDELELHCNTYQQVPYLPILDIKFEQLSHTSNVS